MGASVILNEGQVRTLKASFAVLKEHGDEFAERVYTRLLDATPEASRFLGDLEGQELDRNLIHMLDLIIQHADSPEEMQSLARNLGSRQLGRDVPPRYVAVMTNAMLTSASEMLGEEWTTTVRDTWGQFAHNLLLLMLDGLRLSR